MYMKHKEGEPIIISLDQAIESTSSVAEAVKSVVEPIRSRIRCFLDERERITVAVAGGSAVGKSDFFTPALVEGLPAALIFSEDDYCVGNSVSQQRFGAPNLHVPEDFDPELLAGHVAALKRGEDVEKPVYSYETRERIGTTRASARRILVVEGEFLLHPPLSDQFDVKIFIDSDDHSRFVRRMIRPRRNPNQTDIERVMEYFQLSFPHYHSHIAPTMGNADFVIENGYHPQEGFTRIENHELEVLLEGSGVEETFKSMYPAAERRAFARHYFSHPKKQPTEVLYFHSDDSSGKHFRYSCGIKDRSRDGYVSPWVRFDLGEESVDLRDVGFAPTVRTEGKEWSALAGDSSARLIQLSEDRKVIQITQPVASSHVANHRRVVQRLLDAGLTKNTKTLDEWFRS